MSRINPIHYKRFEKFLKYVGCSFKRQKGDHRVWSREDLKRPIVIPAVKEIPVFIITNNLRVLRLGREEYLEILKEVL